MNAKDETISSSIPLESEMETIISKANEIFSQFSFESGEKEQEMKQMFDLLALMSNFLQNEVRSKEDSYSDWKSTLDKEIKELENSYNELRGSERSLKLVKGSVDCVRKDAEEMKTHLERSKKEMNCMEKKVERNEPKLFHMYQSLIKAPRGEEKENLRDAIREMIETKRSALDAMNLLVNESERDNESSNDESWSTGDETMLSSAQPTIDSTIGQFFPGSIRLPSSFPSITQGSRPIPPLDPIPLPPPPPPRPLALFPLGPAPLPPPLPPRPRVTFPFNYGPAPRPHRLTQPQNQVNNYFMADYQFDYEFDSEDDDEDGDIVLELYTLDP